MSQRFRYNLLGVAIALIVWEIAGRLSGAEVFAPVSAVLPDYVQMLRDGEMLGELAGSLRQMLVGYGLACLIGLPLGVAMGRSRLLDALLHPWLSMFVVTSVAALVPLFVLVLGTGFWFRAAIVFVATVWYVVLTIYHGARGIEPRLLDVGRAFGAGRLRRFSGKSWCRRCIPISSPRCASASCMRSGRWSWPRCSLFSAMAA